MQINTPLAERLRPKKFENYFGQKHLLGKNCVLRKMIDSGNLSSIIFWGPPGVGKTTLARLIANHLDREFYTLSAINSGVKDLRDIFEKAKNNKFFNSKSPILFIDEIHRFSKSQQDSLLAAVEEGNVILIGATTENPSFEVISPLLSRCQVYVLNSLEEKELIEIVNNAIENDIVLKSKEIIIKETGALIRYSGGDARKILNILEILFNSEPKNKLTITNDSVTKVLQKNIALYDKNGEQHYDIISAFIKSIRGSDPNAAVYWLARMVAGGEDVKFIARRMVILASEDIGLANPNALLIATSCFQAVNLIGYPEARIILSETTIYLANSPKSNSAYSAIDDAIAFVRKNGDQPVPLHLRNSPTKLMKNLGYGKDYKYSHSYNDNFIEQEFLPEKISGTKFYEPGNNSRENEFKNFLSKKWNNKYQY